MSDCVPTPSFLARWLLGPPKVVFRFVGHTGVFVGHKVSNIRRTTNSWLYPIEPIVLVGGTILIVHGLHWILDRIPRDGACAGAKRAFFGTARKIPYVKAKVEEEISKHKLDMEKDMLHLLKGDKDQVTFVTKLPDDGMDCQGILDKVGEYLQLGNYKWEDGVVSGTVYHGGKDLTELNAKVYQMSTWTNPLHPDVFPGVCKMEGEIVKIVAKLFHGDSSTCGTVTSGGTESIILAVKAYRDYAVQERGILRPEILVPVTAHAAFDKAAQLLNIGIKHVPVIESTCTVDVKKMKSMITKNTIMLVGSAPAYPHGCMDNIQAIGDLGQEYNIPVHTDACLGGFLLAFMPAAGFGIPSFDFAVAGVTSISADTHKYGFAPKGSSVLLFRDKKFKHRQYFVTTEWPGGLYASPTLAGSRPGALIAGCWASLMYFGFAGYVDTTKRIIKTARFIEDRLRTIPGIYIMGNPHTSVIAIASKHFDIYRLQDAIGKKGWSMNALQFPPSIHFCLTYCQTEPGVAEKFVKDVESCVSDIMKDPNAPSTGSAAIYGSSQKVPDRSIVGELTSIFIDTLYETDFDSLSEDKTNGNANRY